jgi:A/G-specific adenine glycosylase
MHADFAARVVNWQQRHGRHHLPWQNTRDPYRVWLSEIMLQQTQVATVLEYYARFLARFPDVSELAAAHQDDVLGLWSGLGYYSRARNLHRCAQQVMAQHDGVFPRTAGLLQTLPGIGRSTAAAIASLCFGERVAILDGNVKRVLTRVLGFSGDLAEAAAERLLWSMAEQCLPEPGLAQAMPPYTQGMMDLGATLCTRSRPQCEACPLQDICTAFAQGDPQRYPVKTRKLKRSAQSIWMLWAQTPDDRVWLSQRPSPGVWAGLYCLPLYGSADELSQALSPASRPRLEALPSFKHALTHKDLHLHPVRLTLAADAMASLHGAWVAADQWPRLGLPAPVRKLLEQA